jgi:hypothetical protein
MCDLLGDPLWDTSNAQGRLHSTLLAGIAEFERELIRERTGDGRKRTIAAGVKFGRKRKLSDYQRAEAVKSRNAGETLGNCQELWRGDRDDLTALKYPTGDFKCVRNKVGALDFHARVTDLTLGRGIVPTRQ